MKSIIVVLLASCLFLFGKINVFYLKTDKCNKCSNTSIESYINNLPESNDSKNILIFDKKNEDLEYLFGKNGIFDTIMVDNGKFSDFVKIKSSSDLSLIRYTFLSRTSKTPFVPAIRIRSSSCVGALLGLK